MKNSILIEGKISVNAVLNSNYREVLTFFYDVAKLKRKRDIKQAKSLRQILEKVNAMDIKVQAVDRKWFEINAKGKTHGGIAAIVSERKYQKIIDFNKSKHNIIFFFRRHRRPL